MKLSIKIVRYVTLLMTTSSRPLLIARPHLAPEITVFSDGTPALSEDVNCNFSILEDRIDANDTDI